MTAGGHGFDGVERRGLMFVLSSPSGAGKTTLSRLLIEKMPGLKMSVSATTRAKRAGRGRWPGLSFHRQGAVRADVEEQRALGIRHRVRQQLRHAARAGRSRAVG